ncbi:4'-phosphopantetheinyl transferase superfamily protein [Candidatus Binatia bacterium]|nr:4'-phosphopantetheinyl transferase superfamily protein [Candidatus Binatia bacterium]
MHLWHASLARCAAHEQALRALLSPDERARADRFHFARDRTRFVAGRGLLRRVLGQALDRSPDGFCFGEGPHGKPLLAAVDAVPPLAFNVSHAHELVVVAVATGRQVGVDIEWMRRPVDVDAIACRFFAPGERAAVLGASDADRRETFFACWTRKEAYLKARGHGLTYPLDRFEVTLGRAAAPAVAWCCDEPHETSRWSMRELRPAADYLGAIVVEGRNWRLDSRWAELPA